MTRQFNRRALVSFFSRTGPRRILFVRACGVGGGAAAIAIAFEWCIHAMREVLSLATGELSSYYVPVWVSLPVAAAILGGVAAKVTAGVAPDAAGSGIPQVKASLLGLRQLFPFRTLIVKFFAGSSVLASGFALGREGPTIHLGAAVAGAFNHIFRVAEKDRGYLVACGAGAGLAAAFNAPLAAFIFIVEELRRDLSPVTYSAALIATVLADSITRALFGFSPILAITQHTFTSLHVALPVLVVGVVAGITGVIFSRLLLRIQTYARNQTTLSPFGKGAIVGAAVALVGLIVPLSAVPQQEFVEMLFAENLAQQGLLFLGAIAVLKLLLTLVCYGVGVPGGIFAPMLAQGALTGLFCGVCFERLDWLGGQTPAFYGVVGMAAYLAAVVRAPLTGVVMIAEMTGNFGMLPMLLLGSLGAYMVSDQLGQRPLYDTLMERLLSRTGINEEGAAQLFAFTIEPHSAWDRVQLKNAQIPTNCLVTGVRRGGRTLVPVGSTELRAGDEVSVLAGSGSHGEDFIRLKRFTEADQSRSALEPEIVTETSSAPLLSSAIGSKAPTTNND